MEDLWNRIITFETGPVTVLQKLASPAGAQLYKCLLNNSTLVTLKYVPFADQHDPACNKYYYEIQFLKTLKHKNIIDLLSYREIYEDSPGGYLLFEFCSQGSLGEIMHRQEMSEGQVSFLVKQVLAGLTYLHSKARPVRCLLPENVYMSEDNNVKLANFVLPSLDDFVAYPLSMRPPEVIDGDLGFTVGKEADVWSLGCFIYYLLFGEHAFSPKNRADHLHGRYKPPKRQVSEKWFMIFAKSFTRNPRSRGSVSDIQDIIDLATSIPQKTAHVVPPSHAAPPPNSGGIFRQGTDGWVKSATKNNEIPPDDVFISMCIKKAQEKGFKIRKFYKALLKRKIRMRTTVTIKALIVLHKYIYWGPFAVLEVVEEGPLHVLNTIEQSWHPSVIRPNSDGFRSAYFCSLITKLSKVLRKKIVLHCQMHYNGNWTNGFISNTKECKQLLSFWSKVFHVSSIIFAGDKELMNLRIAVAIILAEEQIALVELLYNELAQRKVDEDYKELVDFFGQNFQNSNRVIETIREIRPMAQLESLQSLKVDYLYARLEKNRVRLIQQSYTTNSDQQIAQPVSPFSPSTKEPDMAPDFVQLELVPAEPPKPVCVAPPEESKLGIPQEQHEKLTAAGMIVELDQVQMNETLGVGSSCTVYRGKYKRTDVAVKVMLRNMVTSNNLKEFVREIEILMKTRHPNLVLFMGACVGDDLAILMEYAAGDNLFKLLHEKSDVALSWPQKLKMCIDVAQGMHFLHNNNPPIIHRDLKSLNLLMTAPVNSDTDPVNVKITDFGISRILDIQSEQALLTGQMGTWHWMAPEVLQAQPYNLPADVYSFGIVMWEIVSRRRPYEGMQPMLIPYKVLQFGERPDITWIPESCPKQLIDLIQRCWVTNPAERPTFDEVLDNLESIKID